MEEKRKKVDRAMIVSIAMHKSILDTVDAIAKKAGASRSSVIEAACIGWINAAIYGANKEQKEKQNELNN